MVNDYKPDAGKPPVMDAVFIPYRRTLLAIAAMKADMAKKHKLQGAANPFEEWKQLPDGKRRLANAGARHALQPWTINTKDGTHLHIIHAIVGLMMAAELHLEERDAPLERLLAEETSAEFKAARAAQDAAATFVGTSPSVDHQRERARIELALRGEHQADNGQYWTGDSGTWYCCCGAGRPAACTCNRQSGEFA
jgi:hypothetical protein